MKNFNITLSKLDRAVVTQMGGTCKNTPNGCRISTDTAEELANVSRSYCGAAGGFSGFTWYSDTREFTAKNRAEIVAALREQIDAGLFEGVRGVVGAVMMFNCLKKDDPAEIEEEAARVLFGSLRAVRSSDLDRVANALAWGALEDLAYRLDGAEIDENNAND